MVKTGLDLIFETGMEHLRGARVGLLCHPASVDSDFRHAVELFQPRDGFSLTALFGPQHGILGNTQDNMIEWKSFTYPGAGVPAHSLYSEKRKPSPDMLRGFDVLVIDLQDVGTRVYTFIWTMYLCMQACAEAGKRVVVLDRPNPIGGVRVEGNVLRPEVKSFVGLHPIPMRHGMTAGELALMFNEQAGMGCDLQVVRMAGWRREMLFTETGLPWVLPSPNMPTQDTALVYPGTVVFEGTNVSEGRGTTRPFELIGAPWINAWALAADMNGLGLPGCHFRPAHFEPTFHKGAGQICGGAQIHITDAETFKPYLSAIALLSALIKQDPEKFGWKQPPYEYEFEKLPIDLIIGDPEVRKAAENGLPAAEIEKSWLPGLDEFKSIRNKYLIY